MKGDRYSQMDGLAGFGFLVNALSGGGDAGQGFPQSDAEDLSRGARFIPGEVTLARRRGERVEFLTDCDYNCWYWRLSDGTRIYHFDPLTFSRIAERNGKTADKDGRYTDGAGPCPLCGNRYTNGGTVKGNPNA